MPMQVQEFLRTLADPFMALWSRVLAIVPAVLAALVLMLVGFSVARLAHKFLEKFLSFIRLDDMMGKVGFNEILSRVGFGRSPTQVFCFLAHWMILLLFLVLAANIMQLTVVSELLQSFAYFIPKLVASILIVFGGLVLGSFISGIVQNAAESNKVEGAAVLGKLSHVVVVIFVSLMALQQLGIDTTIVSSSLQIILGSFGLAFALAFGLGAKDVAADIIRNFLRKK